MNNISLDELLNQMELMKQVLEYYANTENYHPKRPNVMMDGGHNARNALERLKNTTDDIVKSYMAELKQTIEDYENAEDTEEKLNKILNIIAKSEKK